MCTGASEQLVGEPVQLVEMGDRRVQDYLQHVDPLQVFPLVRDTRVARLATVSATGAPHLVPVTFALAGPPRGGAADPMAGVTVYTAVDHKPKSGRPLRRITNVEETGRGCLLVDHYDEEWSALWWVRLDADARVLTAGEERESALDLLVGKYVQYAGHRPDGPVLALDVTRSSSWSAR